jgi:hypothetical protein
MIPTCKEVSALLSQGQDRALRWPERLRLRVHLLMCNGCRHFEDHLHFLRRAVRMHRDRE